jgi:hypothetical protein
MLTFVDDIWLTEVPVMSADCVLRVDGMFGLA